MSAYLRLRPGPYAFLLESVEGGEKWARYSFLGSDPHLVLSAKDGRINVRRGGRTERLPDGDPLEALRGLLRDFQPVAVPGLPRFQGGAVGYLAYDMVRHMERLPAAAHDDLELPDAVFMLSDTLLVFDNLRHRLLVMANAHIGKRDAAALDTAYDRAALKIGMTLAKLARPARAPAPLPLTPPGPLLALGEEGFTSTMDEDSFAYAVRRAKEYIAAGDAYQIVLARRLDCGLKADPKERAEHVMLVDLGRNDVGRVSRPGTVKVEEREVIERYSHVMHMVSQVSGTLDPGLDAWDVIAAAFPAGTVSGAPKVRALEIIDELEPLSRGPYAGAAGYVGFDGDMDLAIVIRSVALSGTRLRFQAGAGIVHDSTPEAEYQETAHKLRAALVAIAGDEAGR